MRHQPERIGAQVDNIIIALANLPVSVRPRGPISTP
jgi:hypothetical protein